MNRLLTLYDSRAQNYRQSCRDNCVGAGIARPFYRSPPQGRAGAQCAPLLWAKMKRTVWNSLSPPSAGECWREFYGYVTKETNELTHSGQGVIVCLASKDWPRPRCGCPFPGDSLSCEGKFLPANGWAAKIWLTRKGTAGLPGWPTK